jgi:hypothetical protein
MRRSSIRSIPVRPWIGAAPPLARASAIHPVTPTAMAAYQKLDLDLPRSLVLVT